MASAAQPLTKLDLDASVGWKKIASGKVREIFEIDASTLLFVATDRISAYDYIMENVGPLSCQPLMPGVLAFRRGS